MALNEREILDRLRDAVVALKDVRAQRDALLLQKSEPIAIIGMACRFPGDANTPETYFDLLLNGVDTITAVPDDRWLIDSRIDADPRLQGARWGAFVKNADMFDPAFFGISPREAEKMDPQQRFLLELTWEALERSGVVPSSLAGSKTGVFVGILNTDYYFMNLSLPWEQHDAYSATGNGHCFPAGRLAYAFGFQGPAISVDTACSSSLVATHLGLQSLRSRECDVALVCGVNHMLHPLMTELIAKTGALAPDGRCKSFDSLANGYVRGEGCGVIVLKRLSDAQRSGDPIIAVIRGSAVNQDGRSTGLTTPNVLSQEAMLAQALASAQLSAEDIGYIEAHGTGTPLGDPIEMDALRAVYGKKRANGARCWIGTVKTNIGHLEAAAGVAGLMKTALALQQEKIPTNLHFKSLNPRISLRGTDMGIATEMVPWPRSDKPRRAGVSSFGMSGTNAHIILEEAPKTIEKTAPKERSAYLLPLSAKTPEALSMLVKSFADWFTTATDIAMEDMIHTASLRREHHDHRIGAIARTREELIGLLSSFAHDHVPQGIMRGHAKEHGIPKICFVFPGQGSQWIGMGRELLAEEPIFREAIEACDRVVQVEAGFSILEQLEADETKSRLTEIDVVQPVLFAFEVALATLWQSWGITPDFIVGHSMGEVAATHVAGMLTLEDAVKVICRRSRLMRRLSGQGAMAMVELPMAEAEAAVAQHAKTLSAAVSNGPRTTVLSGDPVALDKVIAELELRGVFCRRVKVDVASHSPQVDVLHDELLDALRDLRPTSGKLRMVSTVTGKPLHGDHLSALYWWNNLRQPVRFSHVTQELMREHFTIFLELSPHPILLSALEETLHDGPKGGVALASLVRQTPQRRTLRESLGKMWVHGLRFAWSKVEPGGNHVVTMPTYPWQRQRYWLDIPKGSTRAGQPQQQQQNHPLLGPSFTTSTGKSTTMRIWQSSWSLADLPYFADHRIGDQIIVPGAAYIESALAAARDHFGPGPIDLADIVFSGPLILNPETAVTVEIALSLESSDHCDFRFSSLESDGTNAAVWKVHARARLLRGSATRPTLPKLAEARQRCGTRVDLDTTRATERSYGLDIGPAFQGLQELWRDGAWFLGRVELPAVSKEKGDDYFVHPILLDSALRALIAAVPVSAGNTNRVILGIRTLHFWDSGGSTIWNVGELPPSAELDGARLTLFGSDESAILALEGIETGQLSSSPTESDFFVGKFFCQQWIPFALPQQQNERIRGRWLLLCDAGGFADDVQRLFTEDGAEVIRVHTSSAVHASIGETRTINPAVFSEMAALIADTTGTTKELAGIIDCWGLGQNAPKVLTREHLLDEQMGTCAGALHLVQALLGSGLQKIPALWLIVRGTQTIETETEAVGIVQAPLWGLGRAIAAESSDLRCVRLDLDPRGDSSEAQVFRTLLRMREMDEDEIAIRNGRAFVGRLVTPALKKSASPAAQIYADASYLITGGLGGLGLIAAKWLAKSGAKHIALMSRRGVATPAQAQSVHELEALGAQVLVLEADVGIADQLSTAFVELDSKFPPLRGILHTAGIADLGVLEKQNLEKFRTVFVPKVVGTWNLHELTRDRKLDFFILYSSMAALLGSLGVSNYVAANTFLDTFASYRRAQGLAATSINWGWFEESGLRHVTQQNAVAAVRGFKSFDAIDGERLLDRILHEGWLQMGLLSMDFHTFVSSNPHLVASPRFSSFLSRLDRRQGQTAPTATDHAATLRTRITAAESSVDAVTKLRNTLSACSDTERLQRVDNIVREQLGHVLHMKASLFDSQDHLQQYGVDSLMTIELRNRLQSLFGVRLSITDIWSQSNIGAITNFLLERLGTSLPSTPSAAKSTSGPSGFVPTSFTSAGGWLVTHKPRPEARMRLICIPYAGGGAPMYAAWPDHFPAEIEVIAVQPPGRYERIQELPPKSIQEIVDVLVPALLPVLNVPFALFGHCLGAIIMFEVARRLEQKHGVRPIHLFASGSSPPQFYLVPNALSRSDEDLNAILRAVGFADESVLRDDDVIRSLLPVVRSDFQVAARYEYVSAPRINAPLTAFVGDQDVFAPAHIVSGWQAESSYLLTTHTYSGGHYFLVPERQSICRIISVDMQHDCGSIAQIAATQSTPERWIVRIEARDKPRLRIFCCSGLGSDASIFAHLADVMPTDVELCAIELPGHGSRAHELPVGRVEDLVSCIASALTNWLDRPFAFLGLDLGALVLYDVMRRIRSNGGPSPKVLFVLGAMAPRLHYFAPMHYLPADTFANTLRLFGVPSSHESSAQRALRADCAALTSYQYRDDIFITTPIVAFVAEKDELVPPMSLAAWQHHTVGRFDLHRVPCTHSELHSNSIVLGVCYLTISEIC